VAGAQRVPRQRMIEEANGYFGTTRKSNYLRPHSFALFEAFKIVGGKIRQVEAVFFTVPYNMPSPWPAQ
jgi:hypothetical protein